jgi:hypothetical protein
MMNPKRLSDKVVMEVLDAAEEAGSMAFAAETGVYVNGRPEMILIPAKLIVKIALEVQELRKKGAAELNQIKRELGMKERA